MMSLQTRNVLVRAEFSTDGSVMYVATILEWTIPHFLYFHNFFFRTFRIAMASILRALLILLGTVNICAALP